MSPLSPFPSTSMEIENKKRLFSILVSSFFFSIQCHVCIRGRLLYWICSIFPFTVIKIAIENDQTIFHIRMQKRNNKFERKSFSLSLPLSLKHKFFHSIEIVGSEITKHVALFDIMKFFVHSSCIPFSIHCGITVERICHFAFISEKKGPLSYHIVMRWFLLCFNQICWTFRSNHWLNSLMENACFNFIVIFLFLVHSLIFQIISFIYRSTCPYFVFILSANEKYLRRISSSRAITVCFCICIPYLY